MKYACADFTFPLMEHDAALQLIKLLGFEGTDVGLLEKLSHLQPSVELTDPEKSGRRLGARLEGLGLETADVFLQMDTAFDTYAVNHPDAHIRTKAREYMERTIAFTNACGGEHITILPGVTYNDSRSDYDRTCEELAWRVEKCRDANITVSVEAHLGSITDTPEKAEKLISDVPGLTLTLDYSHFIMVGIPVTDIAPLLKYASHFHARGAARGRLQTVVSESAIDFRQVVRDMKKYNYSGWVEVEYTWSEWEGCNRTDNVSESLTLLRQMKDEEGL